MDERPHAPAEPTEGTPPPRPPATTRGRPAVAWLLIALAVAAAVLLNRLPAEAPAEDGAGLDLTLMRIQAQYLTAVAGLIGDPGQAYRSSAPLNRGSLAQRQRYVLLAAELGGPAAAERALIDLDDLLARESEAAGPEGVPIRGAEHRLQEILRRVYLGNRGSPVCESATGSGALDAGLSPEEREFLLAELGWFSGPLLSPAECGASAERDAFLGQARRVTYVALGGFGLLLVAGCCGTLALVVLLVQFGNGRLRPRLRPGRAPYGVYVETFAVWMALFLLFQILAGLVAYAQPALALPAALVGFLLSLLALAWPRLRGVAWSDVRRDVGLTAGVRPGLEVAVGLGGYVTTLPLLAVGLILSLVLLLVQEALTPAAPPFAPSGGPAHPVVFELARSGPWTRLLVLLLAAVAAPLVEETMFRGVLYRSLRDWSARWGRPLSVLFSGALNAFLFAAIHPQGWVAIPALMALAWSFVLLREWRDTLLPAMIVHGVSNGLVMLALLLAIGSG